MRDFILQNQLLSFEFCDARFNRALHSFTLRVQETVEQFLDPALRVFLLLFKRCLVVMRVPRTLDPRVFEDGLGQRIEPLGRL